MEKQLNNDPDQSLVLVNLDVLNTILLSFHPASKIKDLDLSDYTREGLAELQELQDLIHMDVIRGYDGYGRRLVSSIDINLKLEMNTTGPRELAGATTRTCPSGWPTSRATTPPRWLSWAGSSASPPR